MPAGGSVLRRMNTNPGLTVLNEAAPRYPRRTGDKGEVSDTHAQVNRPRHDRCPAHRPVGGPGKSRRGEQYECGQGDVMERAPGHPNPGRRRRQTHDNPADTRHSKSRSMPKGEQCQPVTKLVGNNKDDGDRDNMTTSVRPKRPPEALRDRAHAAK